MIEMIAAMSLNGVIGKDNKLPWNYPDDMTWFVRHTTSKTLVMGRKTYESIGGPLRGRINIVLTSRPIPDVICYDDIYKVMKDFKEFIVIGGANIYEQFLPYTDKIYLTKINKKYEGDSFFPKLDYTNYLNRRMRRVGDLEFYILYRKNESE